MARLVYEPVRGVTDYVEAPCSAVLEALSGSEAVVRLDTKRTAVLLAKDGVLLVCIDHVDKGTVGCWPVRNQAEISKKCKEFEEVRQ